MSGAFLGLKELLETGPPVGGLTVPPRRTLGAVANAATRAAGLAVEAKAVPCCACKKK